MPIAEFTLKQKCKSKGMCKKSINIEKSCLKFEEMFLKHKQDAADQKRADDVRYNQLIQDKRGQLRNSLNLNHNYMKEWDIFHNTNWVTTVKEVRKNIRTRMAVDYMLGGRIMNNEADIRKDCHDQVYGGIADFEGKALRQGIDFTKNPDNVVVSNKGPFNAIASMQKIKNRAQMIEKSKHEKEKRQRKMNCEAIIDRALFSEIKNEEDELIRYSQISQEKLKDSEEFYIHFLSKEIYQQNIYENVTELEQKKMRNSSIMIESMMKQTKEEYFAKKKEAELKLKEYLQKERIGNYQKHYNICFNIQDYMNDMSEAMVGKMGENIDQQVDSTFWGELERKLMAFESLNDNEDNFVFDKKNTTINASMLLKSDPTGRIRRNFPKYLDCKGKFAPAFNYNIFRPDEEETYDPNFQSDAVRFIIDKVHPITPIAKFPIKIINHLPLKINIIGKKFSGRKTLAEKLKKKLGLEMLVQEDQIEESVGLNKVENDIDKKLADKKKKLQASQKKTTTKRLSIGVRQKNPNDIEEEEIDVRDQQQEFKEVGEKIMLLQQENEDIPDDIIVELIIKKLACLFPLSTKKGILEKYNEAYQQIKNAEIEEAMPKEKSPGKPSVKKGTDKKAADKKDDVSQNKIDEEPPLIDLKKFFFSNGFVQTGWPLNANQAKLLDSKFTGFVQMYDRLNKEAEEHKIIARRLLDIQDYDDEENAFPLFDQVVYLDSSDEVCRSRGENRKRDPATGDIYNMELNPPPENDKKLLDRLVDVELDTLELDKNFSQLNSNESSIRQWYQQFGQYDVSGNLIKPYQPIDVDDTNQNSDDILKQLITQVGLILESKYAAFELWNQQPELLFSAKDGGRSSEHGMNINDNMSNVSEINNLNLEAELEQKILGNNTEGDGSEINDIERMKAQLNSEETTNRGLDYGSTNKDGTTAINERDINSAKYTVDVRDRINSAPVNEDMKLDKIHEEGGDDFIQNSQEGAMSYTEKKERLNNINNVLEASMGAGDRTPSYNDEISSSKLRKSRRSQTGRSLPQMTVKDKILARCSENWVKITESFINGVDKEIGTVKNQMSNFYVNICQKQKIFAKHFERNNETTALVIKFIENYGRFCLEQPVLLKTHHCKEQLIKKVEGMHDKIWEVIEAQKDLAVKEKEDMVKSGWINKEVEKYMESFMSFAGCELNKIHYLKLCLQYYFAYTLDCSERLFKLHADNVRFDTEDLPDINTNELVPYTRIDYVIATCEDSFDELIEKMMENENLPIEFVECIKHEIKESINRIQGAKRYIVHKIKKTRVIYANLQHRMQDWVVYSCKTENSLIYDLCTHILDCIRTEESNISFDLKYFDPLIQYRILDYSLGPKDLILPPEELETDDYFTITQLYFFCNDLRNMNLFITDDGQEVNGMQFDVVFNYFQFRLKNNNISNFKIFPESWIGKNFCDKNNRFFERSD